MTKKRFVILVLLVFFGAFFWAGGQALVPKKAPLPSLSTPASLAVSPETNQTISQAVGVYERLRRLIALKSAVDAKLDHKNYVKLKDIPVSFQQALIAVEDNRFYHHYGFDVEGILRAALVNMQTGGYAEGGSTITQQLVKNLFLSQDKTVTRKLEEFALAIDMETRYSKDEILEMYINSIYFGSGAYGIKQACHTYFGEDPSELTLAQSALLAGLPNAPSVYSPFVDFNAAKQRQSVVLSVMAKNSYIGPSLSREAMEAPLHLKQH